MHCLRGTKVKRDIHPLDHETEKAKRGSHPLTLAFDGGVGGDKREEGEGGEERSRNKKKTNRKSMS